MGDQAPPALAAMMINPAKYQRSDLRVKNFLKMANITMVVVRLSSTADRKKVSKHNIQSNTNMLLVFMTLRIISKPLWMSINSTMVIAPSRKKRISAISSKCSLRFISVSEKSTPVWATMTHNTTPINKAVAALSILTTCSSAIIM